MARSVSKREGRGRERSLSQRCCFSSDSADIKTWQSCMCALVQHSTSPHKANTDGCARLDHKEEITNSSQAVTWATAPLDVPTEECFWKISSCCLRQQQSYADKTLPPARHTSHLHDRAPPTQLHEQSLYSALHKITTHPSSRGSLRALHIIDIKQKSKSD